MSNTRFFYSMSKADLRDLMEYLGQPKYRKDQLHEMMYKSKALSIDNFSTFSSELKSKLKENYALFSISLEKQFVSKEDGTEKYLFKTSDGEYLEAVLMSYKHGYSACISTQIGCKMGCRFCASSQNGFARGLKFYEMLEQIVYIQKLKNIRISNVVLMGIGEPLDNYDEVMRFIDLVTSPDSLNLGIRKITVSTCGLVEKIERLATEGRKINLAISLHNPFDKERAELMPIAKRYSVRELISGCDYYIEMTSRRVMIEYSLIAGENDSPKHAGELADLIRGKLYHVNLIALNSVKGVGLKASGDEAIQAFWKVLNENGISVTLRRTLGSDIAASCGQLRNKAQ